MKVTDEEIQDAIQFGQVTEEHLASLGLSDFANRGDIDYEGGNWSDGFQESLAILIHNNLIPRFTESSVTELYEQMRAEGIPQDVENEIRLRPNSEPVLVSTKKLAYLLGHYRQKYVNPLKEFDNQFPGMLVPANDLPFENDGKLWDMEASIYNYNRLTRIIGYQKIQYKASMWIMGKTVIRHLFGFHTVHPTAMNRFICLFNAMAVYFKHDIGSERVVTDTSATQPYGALSNQARARFEKYKPIIMEGADAAAGLFNEGWVKAQSKATMKNMAERTDNDDDITNFKMPEYRSDAIEYVVDADGKRKAATTRDQVNLENKRRVRLQNDVNESRSIYIDHFLASVTPITARLIKRIDAFESFVYQVFPSASGRQMERIRKGLDNTKNDLAEIPEAVLGPIYSARIGMDVPKSIESQDRTEELRQEAGGMGEVNE